MSAKVNYLDCNQSQMGTGVLSCEIKTGVPYGFFRTAPEWRFDPATETFDDAYITDQIKKKNLIPFLKPIGFDFQNEEAEIFTSNLKVRTKVMDGLPGFSFDYNNGPGFHKAAYSFNSFGGYGVLIAYNNGVIDGAFDGTGKIKGYVAGMMETGNYAPSNGSDPQKTTISFQLLDAYEYNMARALLASQANGFSLAAIGGVIDATIKKISNNVADVVIEVKATNNNAISIAGLTAADFAVSGTSETIDSVTYDPVLKQYTLTFSGTVAGDYNNLRIQLYDTADSTFVIKKGTSLYQGGTA